MIRHGQASQRQWTWYLTQSGHNELTGSAELSANRALSVSANKLHPVEPAAAEPSVTERYQCHAETQSRSGR